MESIWVEWHVVELKMFLKWNLLRIYKSFNIYLRQFSYCRMAMNATPANTSLPVENWRWRRPCVQNCCQNRVNDYWNCFKTYNYLWVDLISGTKVTSTVEGLTPLAAASLASVIQLLCVAFRMAAPLSQRSARLQGGDPPQKTSTYSQTEAPGCHGVYSPQEGRSSRRVPAQD